MREVPGMVMLAVIVAAFVSGFHGWGKFYDEVRNAELQGWRRTTALLGMVAVTFQAFLFIAVWTPLGRHNALLPWLTRAGALLFLIALPCIATRMGGSRWWLLLSSTVLGFFYSVT